METILIATDFSSAARNATIYALELARKIQAKVILFTAYQLPIALPDSTFYVTAEELEKNSSQQLLDEAALLDPQKTVALETQARPGPINNSILTVALQNNVSYIVVGMKERGKEIRKYFGSTVTHLFKTSTVPLIVVPANVVFSPLLTIALASDVINDSNIHILDPLKQMAKSFNSKLFIVRVIKEAIDEDDEGFMRDESVSSFFKDVDHHFKFVKAVNVAKALNAFVKQHAVNMVVVMPHEHTSFERIFIRSVTKDLVFNSDVPLLIFPYRDTIREAETGEEIDNEKYLFQIY